MASTLEEVLEGTEEVKCPICERQLFVSGLPDGKRKFEGCGRNCVPMYWVPEDSFVLGPQDGPLFVYHRKVKPDEPAPKLQARYTNGAW